MKKPVLPILAFVLAMFPALASAQSVSSVDQIFANLSDFATSGMDFLVGAGFVMGIAVMILAVVRLKKYADDPREGAAKALWLFIVGGLLTALPGTINMATETLSLGSNSAKELLYANGGGGDIPPQLVAGIKGVLLFVKLIGHAYFLVGVWTLKKIADGDRQQSLGSAGVRMLAGAAAININATAKIAAATFAPGLATIPMLVGS